MKDGFVESLQYLGYLGAVPIVLGLRLLLAQIRSGGDVQMDMSDEAQGATSTGVLALASTQLSNGVDTVLVFAPLLADSRFVFDVQIAVLFLLLMLLWFGLAKLLSAHAARLPVIARFGNWLAPLVMIGVGLYILGNTATDMG